MKTFKEFSLEANKCSRELFENTYSRCVKEGKIPWDDKNRPLRSGWTPREKNRAKRISTGVENPEHSPSEKQLERYGKLKSAHDDQKNVKTKKDQRHKNPEDYSHGRRNFILTPDMRMPSENQKGNSDGLRRIPRNYSKGEDLYTRKYGAKNDEKRDEYYKKGPKGLKEPKEEFEFDLYDYELEESSGGERSGRRTRGNLTLARGRGADMTRQERSTAAIAKKAGLKGTGKYSTKDLRTKSKHYTNYETDYHGDIGSTEQDHTIITHSSPRKAAQEEGIISKRKAAGRDSSGWRKYKTAPSSDSVRRLKDFKKQISKSGADKRGRVHSVEINQRDSMSGKGDKKKLISRGKNFIKALKDTPKHLKKAGAKKGDVVIGKPTAVMPGEDEKTGETKRAKLYKKIFGNRSTNKSEKTGLMTGKMN